MSTATPNLELPYIMPAQAQKHVTHNEAIRTLDALVQAAVLSRTVTAPPAAPHDGDRYLTGTGATGVWAGHSQSIAAYQDGAWIFIAPRPGLRVWVVDDAELRAYDGSDWVAVGGGFPDQVPLLGIATAADSANRLAVASAASLFNHAGSGHQLKINKNAAADTASLLFQDGFSGRAEIGLTGDDDLHVKVSADGTVWREALVVEAATGAVRNLALATAGIGNALNLVSNSPALGGLAGYNRTYFDKFGMLATQGWLTISGLYKDLGNKIMEVIYPGATKGSPTTYIGNRLNGGTGGMLGVSNDIVGPNILLQDNNVSGGGHVATGAAAVAGGTGYALGDVLTVSGGTATAATAMFFDSVELAGSGYSVNDIVSIVGGSGTAATLRITAVGATGGVTAAVLLTPGVYSILPPITCPVAGGSGSDFYPNMIWPSKGPTVLTVTSVTAGAVTGLIVSRPGLYTALPGNPAALTGGAGSGATASLAWTTKGQTSRHLECLDYTRAIRFQVGGDGTLRWGNDQDIEAFAGTRTDLYRIDAGTMGSNAVWSLPGLVTTGSAQFGLLGVHSVTRPIAATVNSAVAIGSFNFAGNGSGAGSGALRIAVTTAGSGWTATKHYSIATYYNATAGAWAVVTPDVATGGLSGNDLALDLSQSLQTLSLRLRTVSATTAATAYVTIQQSGLSTEIFTPSGAIGVVTAPTQVFAGKPATQLDIVAKSIATPTTGQTVTIASGVPLQIIKPAATLASLTVALPGGQVDNQRQVIAFNRAITALTITPNGSAAQWTNGTAVAQYQRLEFIYNAGDFLWYRMQ